MSYRYKRLLDDPRVDVKFVREMVKKSAIDAKDTMEEIAEVAGWCNIKGLIDLVIESSAAIDREDFHSTMRLWEDEDVITKEEAEKYKDDYDDQLHKMREDVVNVLRTKCHCQVERR